MPYLIFVTYVFLTSTSTKGGTVTTEKVFSWWSEIKFNGRRLNALCGEFIKPFFLYSYAPMLGVQLAGVFLVYIVGESHGHIVLCMMALLGLKLASVGLRLIEWHQNYTRIAMPLNRKVKIIAMEKVYSLSIAENMVEAGQIRTIIERGENSLVESVNSLLFEVMPTVTGIVISIIALYCMNWLWGMVALFACIGNVWGGIWANEAFISRVKKFSRIERRMAEKFWEKLRNASLVILGGQAKEEAQGFATLHARHYSKAGTMLWDGLLAKMALYQMPFTISCFIGLMSVSIEKVAKGELSPENLIVALWWSWNIFAALTQLTRSERTLMEGWGHVSKFLDFLDKKPLFLPTVTVPPVALAAKVGLPIAEKDGLEELSFERPEGFFGIKFKGVCFDYPREPVPIDIGYKHTWEVEIPSLEIKRGEFVAFIGPSGSGKTTLMNMIIGASFPSVGDLMVSGINIQRIDREWWWSQVGYVPQYPSFWNASMRANILYGRPDVSEEKFVRVMKAVKLYDEFYVTGRMREPMGENGAKLSGGERQRVAIARAIIGSPSVLLFDEAMSGLDNESASHVLESILSIADEKDQFGNKKYTVIVIAHKILTAEHADRVVLMKKGRVVTTGTHRELTEKSALYRKLARLESMNSSIDEGGEDEPEKGPSGTLVA